MSEFERPLEPADFIKMALVAIILDYAFQYQHSSVKDELVEKAALAHFELMGVEGVDVEELFYGEDDKKQSVANALSNASTAAALFTKTRFDGRHHFEPSFRLWSKDMIATYLTENQREASMAVMSSTLQVLVYGTDIKDVVTAYRNKKEKGAAAT